MAQAEQSEFLSEYAVAHGQLLYLFMTQEGLLSSSLKYAGTQFLFHYALWSYSLWQWLEKAIDIFRISSGLLFRRLWPLRVDVLQGRGGRAAPCQHLR